jgi:hypothetical protein
MKVKIILIALVAVMFAAFVSPTFAQQFKEPIYEIRGGTILGFEIDPESTSLIITLDARARGELIITLPRNLIDAKTGSVDSNFEIFVSGLKLNSYDEIATAYDRTITIPFKRANSELIITGTKIFNQVPAPQLTTPQQIEKIIEAELAKEIPEDKAKLLIFSNTQWTGAMESSSFEYAEINGNGNKSVIFACESSFGRQGVFGAKIEKLTQDGYLRLVAIQHQKILSQGTTEAEFGDVLINGNCFSSFSAASPGGGCLIATATYGTELAPQVQQLRELRDNHLLQTELGTTFIESFNEFYYSFSPIIADYERENYIFKEMVRLAITPMVSSLSILNYVDMDSESEVLGYGISLILLNIGMYAGIPAIVIIGIKRKF